MLLLLLSEKVGGGGQNSPVSHIIELSQALQRFQTRLLYVSLPLKLSVYPELVAKIPTSLKGASTLPQFRQMTLELLQNGVEVVDIFPLFMQHKKDSTTHLFAKGHHISSEGARLIAQTLAEYLRATTEFSPDNAHFRALGNTIYQNEAIYIPSQQGSPFCIFGNCNLQAFHNKGAGIASNLAFFLNKEVDYLGRKLIFWSGKKETFDKKTFEECCKRDIAICISFLSGSFVRTSIVSMTKKQALSKFLRGKPLVNRSWSTLDLESICKNQKS